MAFIKANLLSSANSSASRDFVGHLMGTLQEDADKENDRHARPVLLLDRFEEGERASGKKDTDVLVRALYSSETAEIGFNYISSLQMLQATLLENPLRNLNRVIVPNISIEMYPIHPLRLVNTTLSHRLLSKPLLAREFGLMSIDQARQLFLMERDDPLEASVPTIGLWYKSAEPISSRFVLAMCLSFIANKKIRKLDTGKSHLLVCHFPAANPSRPQCYECLFKPVVEETTKDDPVEPGPDLDTADAEKVEAPPETAGPHQDPVPEPKSALPEVSVSQPPPPAFDGSQQLLYINMLQQQVAALQTQLMQMTVSLPSQLQRYPYVYPAPAVATSSQSVQTIPLLPELPIRPTTCDRGTQVDAFQAETASVAVNTTFVDEEAVGDQTAPEPNETKAGTPAESVLGSESLKLVNTSYSQPPTDTGTNYKVLELTESPGPIHCDTQDFTLTFHGTPALDRHHAAPAPEKNAHDIIAGLVGSPEESFYHTDTEGESLSLMHTSNVFSRFKRPLPPKSAPSPLLKQSVLNSRKDPFKMALPESTDVSMATMSRDTEGATEDNISLSFATMTYLQKYVQALLGTNNDDGAAPKEKKKRVNPKLTEEMLMGSSGFPRLIRHARAFKKKGTPEKTLAAFMEMIQLWGHDLFPRDTFKDFITATEKLCTKRRMRVFREEVIKQERRERLGVYASSKPRPAPAGPEDSFRDDELDLHVAAMPAMAADGPDAESISAILDEAIPLLNESDQDSPPGLDQQKLDAIENNRRAAMQKLAQKQEEKRAREREEEEARVAKMIADAGHLFAD
ncbi:hypothetical protein HDV03_000074 [Kappamyces sp. JEL0829]|nr:hypothetical protein HDV03_000074 [Kappamyces sp. JEL0829]